MRFELHAEPPAKVIFALPGTQGHRGKRRLEAPLRGNRSSITPMVFHGAFSARECRQICACGRRLSLHRGRLSNAPAAYGRSRVGALEPDADTLWIYEKLASTFRAVNAWYRYELIGFVEALRFTVYDAGDDFGWHLDTGPGLASTRKLSLSVQLSAAGDYEGGMLEFCATDPLSHARDLGTVIVFPSFLPHRVRKVTRGTRCALVAWMHGPEFR
jgi:PKHD-type hydroxylase